MFDVLFVRDSICTIGSGCGLYHTVLVSWICLFVLLVMFCGNCTPWVNITMFHGFVCLRWCFLRIVLPWDSSPSWLPIWENGLPKKNSKSTENWPFAPKWIIFQASMFQLWKCVRAHHLGEDLLFLFTFSIRNPHPFVSNTRKFGESEVLGSGGLTIGQAGEFDYSGSQAIKALRLGRRINWAVEL